MPTIHTEIHTMLAGCGRSESVEGIKSHIIYIMRTKRCYNDYTCVLSARQHTAAMEYWAPFIANAREHCRAATSKYYMDYVVYCHQTTFIVAHQFAIVVVVVGRTEDV